MKSTIPYIALLSASILLLSGCTPETNTDEQGLTTSESTTANSNTSNLIESNTTANEANLSSKILSNEEMELLQLQKRKDLQKKLSSWMQDSPTHSNSALNDSLPTDDIDDSSSEIANDDSAEATEPEYFDPIEPINSIDNSSDTVDDSNSTNSNKSSNNNAKNTNKSASKATDNESNTTLADNSDATNTDALVALGADIDTDIDAENDTIDETEDDNSDQPVEQATWRANALPDVKFNIKNGRYSAKLTDNTNNKTLHFNGDQGRLDGQIAQFPFEVIVRNVGIGTMSDSQTPPQGGPNHFNFAGVQVHVLNKNTATSAHVVVGHRGSTALTIEGKTTNNGLSKVNDAGAYAAPEGRADLRIVGAQDRSLKVYWQQPNASTDNWIPYNGSGRLPGTQPKFGDKVYVGLITYAYGNQGVPFTGSAEQFKINSQ